MMPKVFITFLMVTYASLIFFSMAVTATKDEGTDLENHKPVRFGGLGGLVRGIYVIYKILDNGEKIYQLVNWTESQVHTYLDGQCFAYCLNTTATSSSNCECDVNNPNEPPPPTPENMKCSNFERHCCDHSFGLLLVCQKCCKGPRT